MLTAKTLAVTVSMGVLIMCLLWFGGAARTTLTPLNTATGQQWLQASVKADYDKVARHFRHQPSSTYCGVTSSAIVLNALGMPQHNNQWNETNVLTGSVSNTVPVDLVKKQGLTIAQLGKILQSHRVTAKTYYVDQLSLPEFRRLIANNLENAEDFVLINYSRQALGQRGGGHISPIAAYHVERDQLLVMDVAARKYQPVWVSTVQLWQAARTRDPVSGLSRGIVMASGDAQQPVNYLGN